MDNQNYGGNTLADPSKMFPPPIVNMPPTDPSKLHRIEIGPNYEVSITPLAEKDNFTDISIIITLILFSVWLILKYNGD